MPRTIISDTNCIILLDKIGELDILKKLFGTIITTSEVAEEFGQPLPSWFQIQQPKDKNYQLLIGSLIDKGEACAIALALESDNSLLIIDDRKESLPGSPAYQLLVLSELLWMQS